jgi:hypothetical protein
VKESLLTGLLSEVRKVMLIFKAKFHHHPSKLPTKTVDREIERFLCIYFMVFGISGYFGVR